MSLSDAYVDSEEWLSEWVYHEAFRKKSVNETVDEVDEMTWRKTFNSETEDDNVSINDWTINDDVTFNDELTVTVKSCCLCFIIHVNIML